MKNDKYLTFNEMTEQQRVTAIIYGFKYLREPAQEKMWQKIARRLKSRQRIKKLYYGRT